MRVRTRNNWAWHDDVIWVFNIRAVGQYFSSVTGWPPMSVCVWLGAYYTFFPDESQLKRDSDGRLLPKEWECQLRSHLRCTLDQTHLKTRLKSAPEKERDDIWWIEPDGSNVEEVIGNIRAAYLSAGTQWFNQMTDISHAFRVIQQQHDCHAKYHRATYFAKRLADKSRFAFYRSLLKAEAERTKHPYDSELDSEV